VLTKAGTIDVRCKRLADHLRIDLSQTASPGPTTGPLTVNETIGKAQWAWACQLAQEWADTEAAQQPFKLWPTEKGECDHVPK